MISPKSISKLLMATALALPMAALPVAQAHAAVILSVRIGPPVLPVYTQPYCPGPGYLWTPGYWAYGPDGYYWVPGVWVLPPEEGLLWTPAWWGWDNGVYLFHAGYWGPQVGFYGGINYGFGYNGIGFVGGEWRGHTFFYNRAVANVGGGIRNVYSRSVTVNNHSRVAFNGGHGGIQARPTSQQNAAMQGRHVQPTANQVSHENFAAQNRTQRASVNNGRPAVPAAASVNSFHSHPTDAAMAARPAGAAARPVAPVRPTTTGVRPANQPIQNGGHAAPQQRPQPQAQPRQASNRPAPPARGGDEHGGDHPR
jgi:hypothetical protein